MIGSLQIHLAYSALIMPLSAKVHRLCYSVDYKREEQEAQLNGKEAPIMFSMLLNKEHPQRGLIEEQLTDRSADVLYVYGKALHSQSLKIHCWAIYGNSR